VVPTADNLLTFSVRGGRLVGVDNGRQESAESYKATYRTAFHGKALAMVTATGPGALSVNVSGTGLRTGRVSVLALPPVGRPSQQGPAPVTWFTPGAPTTPVPDRVPGVDASFSGAENTPPAAMVDGNPATAWSDAYVQPATPLLPRISAARPADWVSLSWSPARQVSGLQAWFLSDAQHARPATLGVSAWDGTRWLPVTGVHVTWPTSATDPATIAFPAVRTTALRLTMTSSRPETPSGFLGITELRAI
jgi:beta-galactosidase